MRELLSQDGGPRSPAGPRGSSAHETHPAVEGPAVASSSFEIRPTVSGRRPRLGSIIAASPIDGRSPAPRLRPQPTLNYLAPTRLPRAQGFDHLVVDPERQQWHRPHPDKATGAGASSELETQGQGHRTERAEEKPM